MVLLEKKLLLLKKTWFEDNWGSNDNYGGFYFYIPYTRIVNYIKSILKLQRNLV